MDFPDTTATDSQPLRSSTPICSRGSSLHISRKTSWGRPIPAPSSMKAPTEDSKDGEPSDNVDFNASSYISGIIDTGEAWNSLEDIAALGLSFTPEYPDASTSLHNRFSLDDDVEEPIIEQMIALPNRPFNKWIRYIQKKAVKRRKTLSCDLDGFVLERESSEAPRLQARSCHQKSSSGSSAGFVTAVRSASVSLASFSVTHKSRRTGMSSRPQRSHQRSRSSTVARLSEDSVGPDRSDFMDQAVTRRLLQRRRVLEEIISSEESYVADAKFLMNVYVTLLASLPSLSLHLRASINRNLNEIVELHDELLGELYLVVPHSEYSQTATTSAELKLPPRIVGHQGWRSLDAVPEHTEGISWLQRIPGMTAEPYVAAQVAKVFGDKMSRFFLYEEYGAKYELMIKDLASAYRTMPQWEVYQKGLEALASSLASINCQNVNPKKSLTIGDLLVKPIQRVCKYPLLFAELLKQTPVCDCPESHIQIENVLIRLRETTTEINRATDDPRMKTIIERSWLLQDRLVFANRTVSRSRIVIRALGHAVLCGVLHVLWQKKDGVDGQYMVCILYRDFLLLVTAAKAEPIYIIQACIGLSDIGIEEVDNGKGVQCHTAPYSWKVVFEHDHQLFEITLSACSAKEEFEWRSRLAQRSSKDTLGATEQAMFGSLSLEVKPLGTVFGKPGTIARRISIQRATTVGSMSGLSHVIIKNTNASKEISHTASANHINRSQSHLTANRVPVLAASRAERIRLEGLLADVWTREVLPYPGMSGRARSEHLVRASATSMIRKLSVASIASNFTKRSGSMASLHLALEEGISGESEAAEANRSDDLSSDAKGLHPALDDVTRPRLSIIPDEKENVRSGSPDNSSTTTIATPAGHSALRRLATLKIKKSWVHDGYRIVTPPLRTSSANSLNNQLRTVISISAVPVSVEDGLDVVGEKEKLPRVSITYSLPVRADKEERVERRGKRKEKEGTAGRGSGTRTLVPEGIRKLFR